MKRQSENAIQALLTEKIRAFSSEFLENSRQLFVDDQGQLIHPGEFGTYREAITREFLQAITPQRLAIDTGFVVDSGGRISPQCDIVIYERSITPLLQNANKQRFFPVESVCAVGEIKSVMTLKALKEALRKLAMVKYIRDCLHEPMYVHSKKDADRETFAPQRDERDQMVTFLICERFDFDMVDKFKDVLSCYREAAPDLPANLRHNLVLSIRDGLLCYLYPNGDGVLYPFPTKLTQVEDCKETSQVQEVRLVARTLKNRALLPAGGSLDHIRHFCTMLNSTLNLVSVFFPDMATYIVRPDPIRHIDVDAA